MNARLLYVGKYLVDVAVLLHLRACFNLLNEFPLTNNYIQPVGSAPCRCYLITDQSALYFVGNCDLARRPVSRHSHRSVRLGRRQSSAPGGPPPVIAEAGRIFTATGSQKSQCPRQTSGPCRAGQWHSCPTAATSREWTGVRQTWHRNRVRTDWGS